LGDLGFKFNIHDNYFERLSRCSCI